MAISSLMYGHHLFQPIFYFPVEALVVVSVGWFCVVWVPGIGVLQVFGANMAQLLDGRYVPCPSCLLDVPVGSPSAHESLFAMCLWLSSSLRTGLLHA